MSPFSIRLAATITFFWVLACEAMVNNLGAIESESYTKSSKDNLTENYLMSSKRLCHFYESLF